MSTKTSIKRIALVAVSALGFGLLSVAPSSAAMSAAVNRAAISAISTAATGATSTAKVARIGMAYTLPVTLATSATAWTAAADLTLNAVFTQVPAGETAYNTVQTTASSKLSPDLAIPSTVDTAAEFGDIFGDGDDADANPAVTDGTGSTPEFAEYLFDTGESAAASLAATNIATVSFTPSVAGTYKILVWADDATGGNTNVYDGGEKTKLITIVVGGAPSTLTVTKPASTVATNIEFDNEGAVFIAELKDAAGNLTTLNNTESITVASTLGTVQDASLTVGDFNLNGKAAVELESATAGVATVTFTAGGSLSLATVTSTVTFTAASATFDLDAGASVRDTTGWIAATGDLADIDTGDEVYISEGKSSLTVRVLKSTTSALVATVEITDTDGAITGVSGAKWLLPVAIAAADDYGTAVISGLGALAEGDTIDVAWNEAAEVSIEIEAAARTNTTLTLTPATAVVATTGSATFTAIAYDQFSDVIAGAVVAFSVAGRNATTVNTQVLTNALGEATYTVTDTSTSTTSLTSTVDADSTWNGTSVDATDASITWGAYTIATNTMTTPKTADATATTTITTAVGGAMGSYATVTATLTSAAGTVVGYPVTFAVSGLTGAGITTNYATVYTDANGVATSRVYSYATGTATVTATAGGVASTGTVTFINSATDARTIAVTASGNVVSALVKDRYGNPVKLANVVFSRTGEGYFGTGGSSVTVATDANGVAEAVVVGNGGSTTVTATLDVLTYTQVDDAEGKVGTTAVTATGAGATLAPAGIATASVVVTPTNAAATAAEAASDAAAEAIDAANAATDAANLAAEAADAATVAAEEARDAADAATAAVEELATQVATLMAALKAQITTLANTVAKIAKKVKA